ncbi:MAG: DUF4062 domain-containing protein [Pyrinomonadaceae bacterium]
MPIGNNPAMFVSSTCYDLRQVRADLKSFIELLGLQPILSEYDTFPVHPDVNAVENCLRVVDENADIFLLIVGGRYGKPFEQEKSVTNMEYLRARAKGIPIYVFVQKNVLNILPVWRDNPEGNFHNVVDSPKLFEFVTSLMDVEGIWVFPFELAQEITDTLRKQLAYLFMSTLSLQMRVKTLGLPESLAQLQGIPLKLVIEQPKAWEFRLFGHVLAQEIERLKRHRLDLKYGLALGKGEFLFGPIEVMNWTRRKIAEARRLVDGSELIINMAFKDAYAPAGVPADPEGLVYSAHRLAETYRHAIEWGIECNRTDVSDGELKDIVRLVGGLTNNIIQEIEEFSARILREIEEALNNLPGPGEPPRVLNFTLTLTVSGVEELNEEMERITSYYSS